MEDHFRHFLDLCSKNSIPVSREQADALQAFVALLLDANKRVNVISRKDEEKVWHHHILSSIWPLSFYELQDGCAALDLGTGGGLPGIPLAIMRPGVSFMLLDATQKKIGIVEEIASALGLPNVRTAWGRAEEMGEKGGFRNSFSYVLARAVGEIGEIIRFGKTFLQKAASGKPAAQPGDQLVIQPRSFIIWKGGDISTEVRLAVEQHKLRSVVTHVMEIAGDEERYFEGKKIVIIGV